MPWVSTTVHSASPLDVECLYDAGTDFHTFPLNTFGDGTSCDDVASGSGVHPPATFNTLTLKIRYTVVENCVCVTSIELEGLVIVTALNTIAINHTWSIDHAIDCTDSFDETTGTAGYAGGSAATSGGSEYPIGIAVSKV